MLFDAERIAERNIQEAIEEGAFDNLPGKGLPLNLDDDPLTPPHLRMANRVLKNAGVRPDWIETDRAIRAMQAECASDWSHIEREYRDRRGRANQTPDSNAFSEWYSRARARYRRSLEQVNFEIIKLNLLAPAAASTPIPYRLAEEMARFDAAYPAPEGTPERPSEVTPERTGVLRDSAAATYRARLQRDKSR